ncbi:MAG: hypothetical protein ACR2K3_00425 [Nocardioides sp.]
MTSTTASAPATRQSDDRGARLGLGLLGLLVAAAALVPPLTGWSVNARSHDGGVAPLSAQWDVRVGIGTVPALALAYAGGRWAIDLAQSLSWRALLLASYAGGLAWILALAFVDGPGGIGREMDSRIEYLTTARTISITDVPAVLDSFVSRIPRHTPGVWTTHVAGHPPGALLFFVLLVALGLGAGLAAGLVVTLLAATAAPGVLVVLRELGAEDVARRAAPFVVLGPAALWMGVSGDALFTAVSVWGLACLARAATRARWQAVAGWGLGAGLLLGACVMLSYGLPLLGLPAIAVLVVARSWRPLPFAVVGALVVVLAFVPFGFRLWEAYPVLRERYHDGSAATRPFSYWVWGDLAALSISAGPLLGAGLGRLAALRERADRRVLILVGGAVAAIVLADVSAMSKAEVERIWLPFVPWLLLSITVLPERWRRRGLWLQLGVALVVQHLLNTTW